MSRHRGRLGGLRVGSQELGARARDWWARVRDRDGDPDDDQEQPAGEPTGRDGTDAPQQAHPADPPPSSAPPRAAARPTPQPTPTQEEIGRIGSFYLLREPSWIRRHVESATFKNLQSARRRLTIDVMLPRDDLSVADRDGQANLYYLPVTTLLKRPPRSNIDFQDESGRSLPLLTREENAEISLAAVMHAAEQLAGRPVSDRLARLCRELVHGDGLDAELSLAVAERLIELEHPAMAGAPGYGPFIEVLKDLAANSLVWVPLRGSAGERRIVKLRYDIAVGPSDLRPQHGTTVYFRVQFGAGKTVDFKLEEPGDWDYRTGIGRVLNRIGTSVGFTAMGVALKTPYIRGSSTYHLQVDAPPGVEIRQLKLLAKLRHGDRDPIVENDRDTAHLYMSGSEVVEMQPAVIELRVGRRGFLSLSTLSAVLIAALLWVYDAAAPISETGTRQEVAAAILLVAPALLLAFAMRPAGEHPYAGRLLVGVRVFILALGLLAVADAAAMTGVRPEGWTVHHAWFVYALLGLVPASVLVLGWVLALESTAVVWDRLNGHWENQSRFVAWCAGAAALATLPVAAGAVEPGAVGWSAVVVAAVVLLLAVPSWLVLLRSTPNKPVAALLAWLVGIAATAAAALRLAGGEIGVRWHPVWVGLAIGMGAVTIGLVGAALALARGQHASGAGGTDSS